MLGFSPVSYFYNMSHHVNIRPSHPKNNPPFSSTRQPHPHYPQWRQQYQQSMRKFVHNLSWTTSAQRVRIQLQLFLSFPRQISSESETPPLQNWKLIILFSSADFWGPVSNFGIPIAAVMDIQKDPEMCVCLFHWSSFRLSETSVPSHFRLWYPWWEVMFSSSSIFLLRFYLRWNAISSSVMKRGWRAVPKWKANGDEWNIEYPGVWLALWHYTLLPSCATP